MAITSLTHLLTAPYYSIPPHLSPDGRSLVIYVDGSTAFAGGGQYVEGMVVYDMVDGSVVPMMPPAGMDTAYPDFIGADWAAGQVFFSVRPLDPGERTVYVTDIVTGKTSVAPAFAGTAPGVGDPADFALMSANGRYMLVESDVPPGQFFPGLLVRDRVSGELRPVTALNNATGGGRPEAAGVSNDGRMVMFNSYSSEVIRGDTNGTSDFFVQDMLTGRAVAVQSSTGGVIGDSYIFNAVMSANGRYVAFESQSANLVADGAAVPYAAYVKDLVTGAIVRVSEDAAGRPLEFGARPTSISEDGRYVTLTTYDSMGVTQDRYTGYKVFVKDLHTGGVGLVNSDDMALSTIESAQISDNGETVVYMGVKTEHEPALHAVFHVFAAPRPEFTTAVVHGSYAGSTGADTLAGALGDDSYVVNHVGDIVIEYAGQGTDTVHASIDNYRLPDNVDNLVLSGAARNATGNALDNLIKGTATANILRGGAGNDILGGAGGGDTLYGDTGFDIARFAGSVKDYTITKTSWRHEVKAKDGAVSYLYDIEHLKFADAEVTFDTDGIAAQAYRIYQAAFDRKPDLAGLGFWISRMDAGVSLDGVARSFVDSVEFKTVFGANPSNAQLVDKMYQHVLHRQPEPEGRAYWLDKLDNNIVSRAETLKFFSESAENQDALIGIVGHGIAYTPYGG
jgi:Ca2+-binding RTX toxin-like protein